MSPGDKGVLMSADKSPRRMTLRQLMTHSEKCSRDLIEQVQATLLPRTTDFRDLNRPVRRRSHYPTVVALINALHKLEQGTQETLQMAEYLHERLQEIREHARRERINRQ
jgi:hypothetical protein